MTPKEYNKKIDVLIGIKNKTFSPKKKSYEEAVLRANQAHEKLLKDLEEEFRRSVYKEEKDFINACQHLEEQFEKEKQND